MANTGEEVVTSNPPPTVEEPVGEVSTRVAVKILIDLKKELVAVTDTDLLGLLVLIYFRYSFFFHVVARPYVARQLLLGLLVFLHLMLLSNFYLNYNTVPLTLA